MTTTPTTIPPQAGAGAREPAAPPRLRRRPAMAVLGVALIAAGGLTAAWFATAADDSTTVVVAADTIYRGQKIAKGDLGTTNVSGLEQLALTPAGDLNSLVGQVATTDLPAGVPILADSVSQATFPGADQTIVGVLLSLGQLPTVELRPGAVVRIVATPRTQDDPPTTTPRGTAAVVVDTTLDQVSGHTVVNVVVPSTAAADLAALAATGRASLILDASTGSGR